MPRSRQDRKDPSSAGHGGKIASQTKHPTTKRDPHEPRIPINLQQLLLNIFKDSFPQVLASGSLPSVLQEIKGALYKRDFQRAFETQEYLEAYAVRWSPSRALCYQTILAEAKEYLSDIFPCLAPDQAQCALEAKASHESRVAVLCLGGGAAEAVAFGGFIRYLKEASKKEWGDSEEHAAQSLDCPLNADTTSASIEVRLVDRAPWQNVIHELDQSLFEPPKTSQYSSASSRGNNRPMLDRSDLCISFHQIDVLSMSARQIAQLTGRRPILVTFFFTLNELYSHSVSSTTKLLLDLSASLQKNSILLVVDSPGSYSETQIGADTKKYPMHWLLDYCLLQTPSKESENMPPHWTKIMSLESAWFRVPEALRYPIPLENMRYQIHVYRKT
ncbi:unnamed protein product [Blumeria hordei]|uniref:25S rRNA (Uridine(2843)-N(3))-methyltransferase n=2 Tax=Blumeria hordei TaxID=2867405 RepID=A0A383UUG7_BLUHO|nr:DUF3115 family conserved protein [Blumeria hordei DH14]SZF03961.1 unnamed protein product [Blumeria hordei]